MSRYSGSDVPFLFVGAHDLLDHTMIAIDGPEVEPLTERTDGLGESWEAHTPTGLRQARLSVDGYFDDGALGTAAALIDPGSVSHVVSTGVGGNVAGAAVAIMYGGFVGTVSRGPKRGELTKARATFKATGVVALNGVLLQTLASKSANWNTEGAESVDHGSSTNTGGLAALHVKANSVGTSVTVAVRHSADDATYADLDTFAAVTPWTPGDPPPATAAQARLIASGTTINRHLAVSGVLSGSGTIELAVAFARL